MKSKRQRIKKKICVFSTDIVNKSPNKDLYICATINIFTKSNTNKYETGGCKNRIH